MACSIDVVVFCHRVIFKLHFYFEKLFNTDFPKKVDNYFGEKPHKSGVFLRNKRHF
jgi:hypothetical protein